MLGLFAFMVHYVYILRSQTLQGFYVGSSEDIKWRMVEHNSNLSRYTAHKGPWSLVYAEVHPDKQHALKRGLFLKRQRNRSFYERLIASIDPAWLQQLIG